MLLAADVSVASGVPDVADVVAAAVSWAAVESKWKGCRTVKFVKLNLVQLFKLVKRCKQ